MHGARFGARYDTAGFAFLPAAVCLRAPVLAGSARSPMRASEAFWTSTQRHTAPRPGCLELYSRVVFFYRFYGHIADRFYVFISMGWFYIDSGNRSARRFYLDL